MGFAVERTPLDSGSRIKILSPALWCCTVLSEGSCARTQSWLCITGGTNQSKMAGPLRAPLAVHGWLLNKHHHDWKVRKLRKKKSPHFYIISYTQIGVLHKGGLLHSTSLENKGIGCQGNHPQPLCRPMDTYQERNISERAVGHRWTAIKSKRNEGVKEREAFLCLTLSSAASRSHVA